MVCLILKANLYLCCFITDVPKPIRYQLFCTFFTFKFFISLISALGMLLCSLLFLCYYNCILLFQYVLDFKNILYMVGLTWKIFVLYEVIQVSELLLPGFCCSGNIVTANGSLQETAGKKTVSSIFLKFYQHIIFYKMMQTHMYLSYCSYSPPAIFACLLSHSIQFHLPSCHTYKYV